ncbi:MAG TPA: AbrB/MazE/SpoVT family DNA-binding domain-containing protein [Longimicrobiaceae bacterium]|jgi:antitoxin MazE|nr:AbrB/MazE/SpoVT family DNA-binding domain-containing protein [Longimicrobiaceae bacterium]
MRVQIQKWGNSLGLRIPSSFAQEVGITRGAEVEISLMDGRLVVEKTSPAPFTLDELLAGITADNVHGEVNSGPPLGKEAW